MMKKVLLMLAAVAMIVAAVPSCTPESQSPESEEPSTEEPATEEIEDDVITEEEGDNDDDASAGTGNDEDQTVVDDNDTDDTLSAADFTNTVNVEWSESGATVSPTDIIAVSVDGGHVVLGESGVSVKKLNVVLSGSTSDGSLKIYNGNKQLITFNGVSLASKRGAAINNQCSKRTFVLVADGTTNSIADAAEYADAVEGEDCKACLFSEAQLLFSGKGTLTVTANHKHAIASDDYLRIFEGRLNVAAAASDAIHINDYVRIDGGTLDLCAESDGIECEKGYINIVGGDITVHSVGEAVKASYSGDDAAITPYVAVSGGRLDLTTTGEKGMAIKAAGDILISGGEITATVSGTASKCLKGDNNITISGGRLDLTTTGAAKYYADEKDTSSATCIKANNNVLIRDAAITCKSTGSGGKGINCYALTIDEGTTLDVATTGTIYKYSSAYTSSPKAVRATKSIVVNGGSVTVSATGRSDGSEGIESKGTIEINGGEITVNSYDDGINAGSAIVLNGGKVFSYATNNDGIDSNGTITINGGLAVSVGSTAPEEGFDCDNNTFKVTGGTVIGMGGATSTPTSSVCTQYCVIVSSLSVSANQTLDIRTADGASVAMVTVPRQYSSMTLLLSNPALTTGSYQIYKGGSVSGGEEFGGYHSGATYSGGSLYKSFTISSIVTGGGQSGPGGPGGGRP